MVTKTLPILLPIDNDLFSLLKEWVENISTHKSYSSSTISAYMTDVYYFLCFLNIHISEIVSLKSLNNLTISDMKLWLTKRKKDGIKNTSNARAISSIKNFLRYLRKKNLFTNEKVYLMKINYKEKFSTQALSHKDAIRFTEKNCHFFK